MATRKPASKKPGPKGSGGFVLDPSNSDETLATQKALAYEWARGVEMGKLPTDARELRMIAALLRDAGDRVALPRKGRGNPNHKLPDAWTVAMMVGFRVVKGEGPTAAVAAIAEMYDVDVRTVRRIFDPLRDEIADWFSSSGTLASRADIIRKNSTLT